MKVVFLEDLKRVSEQPYVVGTYIMISIVFNMCVANWMGYTSFTLAYTYLLTALIGSFAFISLVTLKFHLGYSFEKFESTKDNQVFAVFLFVSFFPFNFLSFFIMGEKSLITLLVLSIGFSFCFAISIILFLDLKKSMQEHMKHEEEERRIKTEKGEINMASSKKRPGISSLKDCLYYHPPSGMKEQIEKLEGALKLLVYKEELPQSTLWDEVDTLCTNMETAIHAFNKVTPPNRSLIQEKFDELLENTLFNVNQLLLELDKEQMDIISRLHNETLKSE